MNRLSRSICRACFATLLVGLFWAGLAAPVQAQQPDNKSGVAPTVINLPSGPGSIQGLGESFQPHLNTGTAAYAIALDLPPGSGGHGPTLALSYDGGRGNGPFGLGWQLALPTIQRQTDKGLPRYQEDDLFVHSSGEELVPLADGTYRFKVEGAFTRFRRAGEGWEATEKDGRRWLLGQTANGRQANDLGVFRWFPQRFIDTNGNEIRFFYSHDSGQVYLQEIRYNFDRADAFGAEQPNSYVSVKLEYEARPVPIYDYRSRALVRTNWRANAVEITALGERVRRYEFSYDDTSGTSLLTAVRLLGRDLVRWEDDPTQGLPPVRLAYSSFDPARSANVSMAQPPALNLSDPNIDLVDINGDALADILVTDAQDGHRFLLNRGRGRWQSEPLYPEKSPPDVLATAGVQIADMDGDGWTDFLVKSGSTAAAPFYYYPSRGNGAWELADRVDYAVNPPFTYEDPDVRLVDLDFDRRIDVLRTTPTAYYVYFNRPDGWSAGPDRILDPVTFGAALTFTDLRLQLADMNGDRLQDLVLATADRVVYFPSRGYGDFAAAVTMDASPDLANREADVRLADVDGDGLADLLLVDRFQVRVWRNQAAEGYDAPLTLSDVPEFVARKTALRLADMNGDGATDLLYANYPASADEILRYVDFTGGTLPNLLTTVDNGLGRVIHLEYRTSTDYYVDDWDAGTPWTLRSPVAVTVVSRSTVEDRHSGQHYVTDYTYRNAYYDGGEKTFRGFALAQQIDRGDASAPTQVTRVIFATGAEDESRKGMVLQQDLLAEDGSCGPDSAVAERSAATAYLRSRAASFTGCYTRTLNELATQSVADAVDGRHSRFSVTVQTDVLHVETTDSPRRTQSRYTYDLYGNQTQTFDYGEVAVDGSDPGLGHDERLTYTEYALNLDAWIVDRPFHVRTTDLAGAFVSEQRTYYDGPAFVGLPLGQVERGDVSRVEANLGPLDANRWVQTERIRYDSFGNPTGGLDPLGQLDENGTPEDNGHWFEVGFDPIFHAYPVTEIIHVSQGHALTAAVGYDLGFGVIIQATDFNGQQSQYSYDGLTRLIKVIQPGDTVSYPTQVYTYKAGNGLSSVESASREAFGRPSVLRSVTYSDGLGRKLQIRSEAENGQVAVTEAVIHNERGQIHQQALPYYGVGLAFAPIPDDAAGITLAYDPLMRTIAATNPDGTVVRTSFRPFAQDTYDEEDTLSSSPHFDTPTTVELDGLGRHVATIERNGSDLYTTRFVYDLLDNLVHLVDNEGNVKTQGFDGLSRKLWAEDPNRGFTTLVYDDAGNLLQSQDARGQQIRVTYDGVNRPQTVNFVTESGDVTSDIIYHYDDEVAPEYPGARNTLGQMTWVEDESGREYLSYDARGNIAGRIKRVREPGSGVHLDFVSLMAYDPMNRMISMTYADGTQLSYAYNEQGLLESIPGYVANVDYIATGQYAAVAYADSVITTHGYDRRLRLTSLRSVHGTSTVLQDWAYSLDGVGNILRIDDGRPDRTPADDDSRSFGMDDLYRLISAVYPASGDRIDYTFSSIGNLTNKTSSLAAANLGTLGYGQDAGPHALTNVQGQTWRYDANGNLISKPDYTLQWDHRDRLQGVTGPNGLRQTHLYDYGNVRTAKQVMTGQGSQVVLYPSRTVEVRDGTLVKYVFAGDMRVAEVHTPFRPAGLIQGFDGNVAPLYGFDGDGDGRISAAEIADRDGNPAVSVDEAEDAMALFYGYIADAGSPVDFATVSATVQAYCGQRSRKAIQTETIFYHSDHLGSATVITNDQGAVVERTSYLPYGQERLRSGQSSVVYRFTGQEQDADVGIYNYLARYYDPVVGRFLSTDPLYALAPGTSPGMPQKLNLYTYVVNNPLNLVDPLGTDSEGAGTPWEDPVAAFWQSCSSAADGQVAGAQPGAKTGIGLGILAMAGGIKDMFFSDDWFEKGSGAVNFTGGASSVVEGFAAEGSLLQAQAGVVGTAMAPFSVLAGETAMIAHAYKQPIEDAYNQNYAWGYALGWAARIMNYKEAQVRSAFGGVRWQISTRTHQDQVRKAGGMGRWHGIIKGWSDSSKASSRKLQVLRESLIESMAKNSSYLFHLRSASSTGSEIEAWARPIHDQLPK